MVSAGVYGDNSQLFRLIVPPDGGWSLTPIENLLRGLRNVTGRVSLELYGGGTIGVVSYLLRSSSGARIQGLIQSYYPQARADLIADNGKGVHSDWLKLAEDENAVLMPLWLSKERYLPMKTYDDHVLKEGEFDPLAGVIAHLSGIGRWTGGDARDRIGMRIILDSAPENWAKNYQSKIQARRDGDDRMRVSGGKDEQAMSTTSGLGLIGLMCLLGVGYLNYELWQASDHMRLAALDAGVLGLAGGAFWAFRKFGGKKGRVYLDEELVEEKIKSLGFSSEVQLVRTYAGGDPERDAAVSSLQGFLDLLRQFDNPAGNSWRSGKISEHSGLDLRHEHAGLGLADPSVVMDWCSPNNAKKSILSAREVATIWHMPLGAGDMASMDRGQSTVLSPYLEGLDEDGPLVGHTPQGLPVRLPESALEKHTLFLGRSGTGKSTMIKQVVYYKMLQKARGLDNGAIVLIDPHADLVRDILTVVPLEIVDKVRLLDLGRDDRVPSINLMDPDLFPDRDRCVGTIIQTLKGLWESWGNRLEEILDRGLKMIYEYNDHEDTPRETMLTILDLLRLLQDGKVIGQGRDQSVELSTFQKHVLSRVTDAYVRMWFEAFMKWPRDTRAEALGPVMNRIGAYAGDSRAKAVLGLRKSTVVFSDILKEGIILLVSTASGTIGQGPAALMGGTIVSLLDSALRQQERLPPSERNKCLLIADEFQTVTGTNWEGMLAEVRKYKCSLMLATQSLAVLDTPERNLKAGIMSNTACLIAYQISAEDAYVVSHQMGHERVTDTDLVLLDPYCCYVRITTADRSLPVFSLKTLPPPEMEHGRQESVDAVVSGMHSYTVDRQEALRIINQEALDFMSGNSEKVGMSGMSVGEEKAASASGAAPPQMAGGGDVATMERPSRPARSSGVSSGPGDGGFNPYNKFITGVDDVAAIRPKDEDGEILKKAGLTNEDIASSVFSKAVLAQFYRHGLKDKPIRTLMDDRLRGKVKHEIDVQIEAFNQTISDQDAVIKDLNERLVDSAESVEKVAVSPVAEVPVGDAVQNVSAPVADVSSEDTARKRPVVLGDDISDMLDLSANADLPANGDLPAKDALPAKAALPPRTIHKRPK